jgi:hypothetical protein
MFMAGLGLAQVLLALVCVVFIGLMTGMAAGLGFLLVLVSMTRKRGK